MGNSIELYERIVAVTRLFGCISQYVMLNIIEYIIYFMKRSTERLDDSTISQIRKMKKEGKTVEEIKNKLNVCGGSVIKYTKVKAEKFVLTHENRLMWNFLRKEHPQWNGHLSRFVNQSMTYTFKNHFKLKLKKIRH